ncbi:MAG: hypothetical protein AAFY41_17760, partial [Bacteroidota bacterium]
ADWVIWLSNKIRPSGRNVIAMDHDTFGWKPISKQLIKFPSSLTSEQAILLELPRKLLDVFVSDFFEGEEKELLTMDLNTFSYESRKTGLLTATDDAASYLWVILIVALVTERWLSYKSTKVAT